MKVLIACEFSGIVREAFRKRGHIAYSCDLLTTDIKGYHFQEDINYALDNYDWDLMIAHPPCTHIACSGARHFKHKIKDGRQQKAIEFVERLWSAKIPKIAIENPIGVLSTKSILKKPNQIIQPWQFGHGETKATCLWLKNLPKLKPSNIVEGREQRIHKMPPSKDRWKKRSITFQGIADAMAKQWG